MVQRSLDELQEFWRKSSEYERDSDGLRPTARDPYLQEVVEHAIEKRLLGRGRLLDIGCGDGLSTLRFAKLADQAVGVDYIENFVARSRENAQSEGDERTLFEVANVLDLSVVRAQFGQFDVVTTIRCLINLATWENQSAAIGEIASCVAPGGLWLVSEGWDEGLRGLNLRRARVGLPTIEVVEYNRMISRFNFELEVRKYFKLLDYDCAGFYLFMSRVFMPKFVAPEPPTHAHPINETALQIQKDMVSHKDFQDCDYAGVYVLRRHS